MTFGNRCRTLYRYDISGGRERFGRPDDESGRRVVDQTGLSSGRGPQQNNAVPILQRHRSGRDTVVDGRILSPFEVLETCVA